jgi:superfamily II DNA or RNA helicase
MSVILKINNDYSFAVTTDQNVRNLLHSKLRFRKEGYFHSRAFKQGIWDGFIDFFNKKTGRFLTGLLPEVRLVLNYFNVPFTTQDERDIAQFEVETVDSNFMKSWAPKGEPDTLYDYQVDLTNQAIKHKRGIVQAPAGAGKTLIMLSLMKALPKNTPILFLANRVSLINQNYKEIKKWGFDNVGRFYSKYHEPNIITCSTVQSAHHLDKLLPKFKAVVADEIHLLSNDTSLNIFKKLKGASIRIAVSATPFKHGGKDDVQKYAIKGYFGPIFKTKLTETGLLKTSYLQERENLSASICKFYYIDSPQIPYDIYIDAVTNGIANNFEFHKLTSRLAKSLKGRTLILVERVAHGNALHKMIPNSLWVYGKDNEETRTNVIEQLQKSKENTVAIATKQIFDTGINFKVHNLIECGDIANEHGVIQLMGRGLRLADDKSILNYYGFIHRTNPYLNEHSLNRIKILKKEGHEVVIMDEVDF